MSLQSIQKKTTLSHCISICFMLVLLVAVSSCQKEEPLADAGTFTDTRDNQTYTYKTMEDGKKWMTQNLNFDAVGSSHHPHIMGLDGIVSPENQQKYGRLYTWDAAKNACPAGWHLPSDDEWWTMIDFHGKAYNALGGQDLNTEDGAGEDAYIMLLNQTSFAAQLGGSTNFSNIFNSPYKFNEINQHGFYWANNTGGPASVYAFHSGFTAPFVKRFSFLRSYAHSCRCIRE